MTNILLVPIHLDALFLERDTGVTGAKADFSKLPYFSNSARHDVNPGIANISEEIVSSSFNDHNLTLKAGMHLHWSLPDALTAGVHSETGIDYPHVPNRWLVQRSENGVQKRWLIESDYVHPEDSANSHGGIVYPVDTTQPQTILAANGTANTELQQPFRYLGRQLPFSNWQEDAGAERLDKLTAVGYGEPTFAAFYPECHSVFGCHDDNISSSQLNGDLSYHVIGWYTDSDKDPLSSFLSQFPESSIADIQEQFAWDTGTAISAPEQICCYAKISFAANAELDHPQKNTEVKVAVAHTGTEALSAYLAADRSATVDEKSTVEEQREAIQLAKKLTDKLDTGPKFNEALHEKSFHAVSGGSLWVVTAKHEENDENNAQKDPHSNNLPAAIAADLEQLNIAQQACNRQAEKVTSLRQQLFADWYKYMLAAYPPGDSLENYPDVDAVMYYIQQHSLVNLDAALARQQDFLDTLQVQKTQINSAITAFNDGTTEAKYTLQQQAAPQYWQAKEPVVLLAGEAIKPSNRHGGDGRLHDKAWLHCDFTAVTGVYQDNIDSLISTIDGLAPTTGVEKIGFSDWAHQPWHPFMLNWQVQVTPVSNGSNLHYENDGYRQDYITDNFILQQQQPELVAKNTTSVGSQGHIYSGSSILTPGAKLSLMDSLQVMLNNLTPAQCSQVSGTISAEQSQIYNNKLAAWLKGDSTVTPQQAGKPELADETEAITAFQRWYETKPVYQDETHQHFSDLGATEHANNLIYTAIKSYQHLHDKAFISQALSGFNDALLMRKQTLQLPIADPVAFADYIPFTEQVREKVAGENKTAPQPLESFVPLRAGTLQLKQVQVIDTFGQVKTDIDPNTVIAPERHAPTSSFAPNGYQHSMLLNPRFVQPAKLSFRWLAADTNLVEMNSHPASSPACGWLLANHLDNSLLVYDQAGQSLGVINTSAHWQGAPGTDAPVSIANIANAQLRQLVKKLAIDADVDSGDVQSSKQAFLQDFLSINEAALAHIDPQSYSQHSYLSLYMGKPMAVVRASLQLELQGPAAVDLGWHANIHNKNDTFLNKSSDNFEQVKIPIRLGEQQQLNDGLIGYWPEDAAMAMDESFHSIMPAANASELGINHAQIQAYADTGDGHLQQSLADQAQTLTLLIDPRAKVHASCGLLPTKAIELPAEQYDQALAKLNIAFLAAPVLTPAHELQLPLEQHSDYGWSWLQKRGALWQETATDAVVSQQDFITDFSGNSADLWQELLALGWLTDLGNGQAQVVARDQRSDSVLPPAFAADEHTIEAIFDAGQINPLETQASFTANAQAREGWIKLINKPGD